VVTSFPGRMVPVRDGPRFCSGAAISVGGPKAICPHNLFPRVK
jgi:hypothetical protein